MLDYDNDGDKDLLAINGYVMPESTFDDEWNLTPSRFWRNPGAAAAAGPWPDIADELGLADTANDRGLLLVDYDLDGDLDVFQANYAGPPRLFRNDGPSGAAWLRVVVLEAVGSRRMGRVAHRLRSLVHRGGRCTRMAADGMGRVADE